MNIFKKSFIEKLSAFTELSLDDEQNVLGGQDVVSGTVVNGDSLEIDGDISGTASISGVMNVSSRSFNIASRVKTNPRSKLKQRKSIRIDFKTRRPT